MEPTPPTQRQLTPPARKRRRRWPWIVVPILAVILFLAGWVFWPVAPAPLALSPKTTVVTGPLNADGTVNYVAAWNTIASQGVTPENNAAIPIVQALGPEFLPKEIRGAVLKQLGISSLPDDGSYFVTLDEYLAGRIAEFTPAGSKEPPSVSDIVDRIFNEAEKGLSAQNRQVVSDWLALNERPLASVEAASRKSCYFIPRICPSNPPFMMDCVWPNYSQFRGAAKAIYLRSVLEMSDGRFDAAWQDALLVHRLGQLHAQQPMLIENLVGMAVSSLADEIGCRVAVDPRLTAEEARVMLRQLQSLPDPPSASRAIDTGERYTSLDGVIMCQRAGRIPGNNGALNTPMPGVVFDVNTVLREVNAPFDRLVSAMQIENPTERLEAVAAAERSAVVVRDRVSPVRVLLSLLVSPPKARPQVMSRVIGDLLLSILVPSLGKADELRTCALMRRQLEHLAFALAIWHADKGHYPETLLPLVPEYIAEVPLDYFTGQPLHYAVADHGYLLYSVGSNRQDDGGHGSSEENAPESADDIVVRAGNGPASVPSTPATADHPQGAER